MKQEIFLKREQQSRKEWLPGGKHSGSLVIPSGQEEILRAGEVDLPASVRAALESGRIGGEDREIRACDLRLKRFRRKNKVSVGCQSFPGCKREAFFCEKCGAFHSAAGV